MLLLQQVSFFGSTSFCPLAAPYASDPGSIYCIRSSSIHILLPSPFYLLVLSGHYQAFPSAISVFGCGNRSSSILAVFTVLYNPEGLPSMPISTLL